jgi:hypothetical protein
MSGDELREHQRFASIVEQAIRMANREVLHPVVDPLTDDKVLAVALHVAKRRADYISATLKLGSAKEDQPSSEELRELRIGYHEARDAFAELMTSIERGYVDLPDRA